MVRGRKGCSSLVPALQVCSQVYGMSETAEQGLSHAQASIKLLSLSLSCTFHKRGGKDLSLLQETELQTFSLDLVLSRIPSTVKDYKRAELRVGIPLYPFCAGSVVGISN